MAERTPTARSREGPGTSWVVNEREAPGLPPPWFILVVLLLGVAVAAITIAIGAQRGPTTHGERAFMEAGGAWAVAVDLFRVVTVRVMMGSIAGATVVAAGFVGRRFTHSAGMGVLVATLVALDPALLVDGQLAVPMALLRFAAVSSLALALGGHTIYHWLVPIPIIVGAMVDPRFLLWGGALSLLILFRGHIFAAPKHLWSASLQGVGIPLLLVIPMSLVIRGTIGKEAVVCGQSFGRSLLLLDVPLYAPGVLGLTNPVVSLGGLAVLAALAIGAAIQIIGTFRVARLPGRIQVRLPSRLGRTSSRALWLALFAMLMPVPEVAIFMGAAAIALGVQAVREDSAGFAATLAVTACLFAIAVVVRMIPVITGSGPPEAVEASLQWMPWINTMTCRVAI